MSVPPPSWGGEPTPKFPPQPKMVPPHCSPPKLQGNQVPPPKSSEVGGTTFGFLPNLEGNTQFFHVPLQVWRGNRRFPSKICRFPSKLGPLQRWGGNLKKSLGGNTKISPPIAGVSPPKFPPNILKNHRVAGEHPWCSPPNWGGLTTMM